MSDQPSDSDHEEPEHIGPNPDGPNPDGPNPDRPVQLDLDTAISAELDGEFGAYATEIGRNPSGLLAEITAQPGYADRRATLQGVRDQLREPAAALDDVTRRRLLALASTDAIVAGAPSHATPHSRTRHTASNRGGSTRLTAAAAILLVVLGGGVFLATRGPDHARLDAAKTAGGTIGRAREGDLGDIGNLSNPSTLDRLIGGPGVPDSSQSQSSAERSAAPILGSESTAASDADASRVRGFQPDTAAGANPKQVQACAKQYAAQGTVRFTASGVYQGQPAAVLGVVVGNSTIVFVVAAADCDTVLFSVSR